METQLMNCARDYWLMLQILKWELQGEDPPAGLFQEIADTFKVRQEPEDGSPAETVKFDYFQAVPMKDPTSPDSDFPNLEQVEKVRQHLEGLKKKVAGTKVQASAS